MKDLFSSHDNFHVCVRSLGREHLRRALAFFFDAHKTAVGFSVIGTTIPSYGRDDQEAKALILHWHDPNSGSPGWKPTFAPFPTPLGLDAVVPVVEQWLDQADYGKEPDQDGDNLCGFSVFNDEDWDKVFHDSSAMCAIAPNWAMLGK